MCRPIRIAPRASPPTPTSPPSRSASSAARGRLQSDRAVQSYVERLKAAGRDVQITEYPNAPHSFDNPLGPRPRRSRHSRKACATARSSKSRRDLINASTTEPFTYKDGCVALGPHLGHDPEATRQVRQAVTSFMRIVFKLN